MSNYDRFAEVYDRLMDDVDYKARTDYLLSLFEKHDRRPTLLLDLACGTGGFSNEFAKRGADVIGVDISEEMLASARQNSAECKTDVLYLCQPAEELDLYGTVDSAVCCLDSLNHITDYSAFCTAISKVSLFLEKGRLFIFDVNTVFKHKYILADNTYVIDREDVYCVWQNETDPETLETDILLDFFIKDEDVYRRSGEEFCERAYSDRQIDEALISAGLEKVAVYADMTLSPPEGTTERAIYVTRKI